MRYRGLFPDHFLVVEADSEAHAEARMAELLAAALRAKTVTPIVWTTEDTDELSEAPKLTATAVHELKAAEQRAGYAKHEAARMLKHYFRMVARGAGIQWDNDNEREIDVIVDHLIDAARRA